MKKYYKYFTILTAIFLFNCEADDTTKLKDYVGFERAPVEMTVVENGTSTKDVYVYTSDISSKDRTYNLIVDTNSTTLESAYTVPATVTVPANTNKGTFTVSVTDDDKLGLLDQYLVIDFERKAGMYFGDKLKLIVTEECTETLVKLTLAFDSYPDEASWELYDLSSGQPTIIDSYGSYADEEYVDETVAVKFCLIPGKYRIVIYDEYGDGGTAYSVTSGSTVIVPETTSKSAISSAEFTLE